MASISETEKEQIQEFTDLFEELTPQLSQALDIYFGALAKSEGFKELVRTIAQEMKK